MKSTALPKAKTALQVPLSLIFWINPYPELTFVMKRHYQGLVLVFWWLLALLDAALGPKGSALWTPAGDVGHVPGPLVRLRSSPPRHYQSTVLYPPDQCDLVPFLRSSRLFASYQQLKRSGNSNICRATRGVAFAFGTALREVLTKSSRGR